MPYPKMQQKAEHAIEDDGEAKPGKALSHAQMEYRKAEDTQCLQAVYNSTDHECTSFDLIDIHLLLHYKESVRHVGH
jgi:hypothetical protein